MHRRENPLLIREDERSRSSLTLTKGTQKKGANADGDAAVSAAVSADKSLCVLQD